MNSILGAIRSHPKTALITASLIVAVTGLYLTSTRTPDETVSINYSEETTFVPETSRPRFGAAVYFPQGTNPSLLEELAPEAVEDGYVNIEDARWKRGGIVVFGTFRGGEIRCELLHEGGVTPGEVTSELQTADDAFLQTFRTDGEANRSSYSVLCAVSGGSLSDERTVTGSPTP